jgi:hypothetical protein
MEKNEAYVQASESLRAGTRALMERAAATAREQLSVTMMPPPRGDARGGRKAHGA